MQPDPHIDAYIDRAAPFARPILTHLRALLAATCPAAEETLKWGAPAFIYRDKILCTMAAFKAHASFGFWQNRLVTGEYMPANGTSAMGQFGKLTSVADLPDDVRLVAMIGRAMKLIDDPCSTARPLKHPRPAIEMPAELAAALAGYPAARGTFDGLPPGQRREYLEWIVTARHGKTRLKRIETTIAQLGEGKRLHWKYQSC